MAIMGNIQRHIDPEEMERYSLGTAPAEEMARVEEHLLICEHCQNQATESGEFVSAMRSAAAGLGREETGRRWRLAPVLAAAACFVLMVLLALRWQSSPQAPLAVALVSNRANAGAAVPAGRTLELHPDLTGLAASPAYRLEMVDQSGAAVWRGEITAAHASATVPRQRAGVYFVRVFRPGGELLREYALEVK